MRYPTLTYTKAGELAERLIAGGEPSIAAEVVWSGAGEEVGLSRFDALVEELRTRYVAFLGSGEGSNPEVFEGQVAGDLHKALRDLPVEALDDPGFWRYLSIAKLWWFIEDRESGPISRGNHMTYVDGGRPTECVPLRMFLRAQAVRDGDDYSLAAAVRNGTDFWRSHVTRVQTGTAPPVARSLAKLQAAKQMATSRDLRPYARQLNRLWANVVLSRLDEPEAAVLLQELYDTRATSQSDVASPA